MSRLSSLRRQIRRQVALIMAWLAFNRVCRLIEWLRRSGWAFLLRLVRRSFAPLVGYVRLKLGWRDGDAHGDEGGGSVEQANGGQEEAGLSRPSGDRVEVEVEDEFDREEYRVDNTDELYCDYDSTWETDGSREVNVTRTRRPAASRYQFKFGRFQCAARDMQNYRHDYPSQIRLERWNQNMPSDNKPNLGFYLGERPSLPDGVYIYDFHDNWYGDYDTLEYVHTYIQWLFPLQEPGMNHKASTLTKDEIKEFLNNNTAKENLLKSYELMLDFYGIKLFNKTTGEVKRASNWRDRFYNLNNHTHNNLRITRILKCLGTLGYPHYQAPLVHFFLEETLVHRELPNIKDSVLNYFLFAVLNKKQRRDLIKFAYLKYEPKDEFVWCPRKIQMMWSGLSTSKPRKGSKKDGCEFDLSLDHEDKVKEEANKAVAAQSVYDI